MGFSIAATAIDAGNLGEARYSQLQSGQPPVNVWKNRPWISIETAGMSTDFHLIFWSPRKCSVLGIKGSVSTNSGYSITSSNHLSTDMSISRENKRGTPCLNAIQCFKIVLLHMSKVAAMVESLSGKGPKIYWANCNREAQVVSFGHTSILCKPTACRRWSTCICKKTW